MDRVLVIGGSRGIGAACVKAFSSSGCAVVFTSLKAENRAKALSAETGARAVFCDVRSADSVNAAVTEACRIAGGIDVLVCCAGVAHFALV